MEISLNDAKPGMQLLQDVLNSNGHILARKDIILNEKIIAALQNRGITKIEIVEQNAPIKLTKRDVLAAESYLEPIFEGVNMHFPGNMVLYTIYLKTIAIKIAGGWNPKHIDLSYRGDSDRNDIFLKEQQKNSELENLVNHETQITSFSPIYFQVKQVLDSPLSSVTDLARIISKDVSLTTKLLQLANSPLYGVTNRIDTIERAVNLIGNVEIATLTLGISTMKTFEGVPSDLASMEIFWKHSIACGEIAAQIAQKNGKIKPENAFVTALMHEIGRLVMFRNLPQTSIEVILYSCSNRLAIYEAEKEIFGYDHATVAAELLKKWNLPTNIAEAIRYQYTPTLNTNPNILLSAIINLANCISMALDYPPAGITIFPGLNEEAWKIIGLEADDLKDISKSALDKIQQITSILM